LYASGQFDRHLRELRGCLEQRVGELASGVEQYLGDEVQFELPRGGASIWLESVHRVDTARVFNRLLEQRIVVAPGELFSVRGLHQQCLRISGSVDWGQNIESMLVIVRNALVQERLG
jgi:DNA-binding transcriptional MocR family regulator